MAGSTIPAAGSPLPTDGISTIIPVFNASRFLSAALDSVFAQTDGEVIVVDDGSSEPVEEIVRAYPRSIYLRHESNRGPAVARNTGLRASSGDIIAFLDADDWWSPDKTQKQLAYLAADPNLQVVLGHLCHTHEPPRPGDGAPLPIQSLGAALFRRSAFDAVGEFDESLRYGEDSEWFTKARELGLPLLLHADIVLHYRRHGGNMTAARSSDEKAAELFGILRRSLRRRQGTGESRGVEQIDRIRREPSS